jgi:hypothetical protein
MIRKSGYRFSEKITLKRTNLWQRGAERSCQFKVPVLRLFIRSGCYGLAAADNSSQSAVNVIGDPEHRTDGHREGTP